MNITVGVFGLDRLLARWAYIARTGARSELRALAEAFAPLLLEAVRSHAPSDTGGYKARMRAEVHGFMVTVTSEDPFAARREFGFVGTDSLGRHYADPPHPHFRPAIMEVGPEYSQAIMAIVRGLAS